MKERVSIRRLAGKRQQLSDMMRIKSEDRMFWFALAARKSWDVDELVSARLEHYYPGKTGGDMRRLRDPHLRHVLPRFLDLKGKQLKEYCITRLGRAPRRLLNLVTTVSI